MRLYCKKCKSKRNGDEDGNTNMMHILLEKMEVMSTTMEELKNRYECLLKKENTIITVNEGGNCYNNCNFVINNFGEENLQYINNDVSFLTKCLHNLKDDGMTNLVKRIHYDNAHPENNNARIKSSRNEVCEVFYNNEWVPMNKNETLDKMMEKGYKVLSTFYHENEDIKGNDIKDNECRLFFLLSKVGCKEKPTYCPMRKKVYALMLSKRHGVLLEGSSNVTIDDPNITLVVEKE